MFIYIPGKIHHIAWQEKHDILEEYGSCLFFFLQSTWIYININKTLSKIPLKMQKMII